MPNRHEDREEVKKLWGDLAGSRVRDVEAHEQDPPVEDRSRLRRQRCKRLGANPDRPFAGEPCGRIGIHPRITAAEQIFGGWCQDCRDED